MTSIPKDIHVQVTAPAVAATPETTSEQRAEVHRKLGRCMLRLQQYELLIKAILVDHDRNGTVENSDERRQARIAKFRRRTLGQLVEG